MGRQAFTAAFLRMFTGIFQGKRARLIAAQAAPVATIAEQGRGRPFVAELTAIVMNFFIPIEAFAD